MDQFAISGYTGSPCLMCVVDGGDIWQTDYFGNRQQLLGKTADAYRELEGTTQQYYDKLVELGVITPQKSQEEIMGEMQKSMMDMSQVIAELTNQIKEMKANGREQDSLGCEPDVPKRRLAKGSTGGGTGDQRDS